MMFEFLKVPSIGGLIPPRYSLVSYSNMLAVTCQQVQKIKLIIEQHDSMAFICGGSIFDLLMASEFCYYWDPKDIDVFIVPSTKANGEQITRKIQLMVASSNTSARVAETEHYIDQEEDSKFKILHVIKTEPLCSVPIDIIIYNEQPNLSSQDALIQILQTFDLDVSMIGTHVWGWIRLVDRLVDNKNLLLPTNYIGLSYPDDEWIKQNTYNYKEVKDELVIPTLLRGRTPASKKGNRVRIMNADRPISTIYRMEKLHKKFGLSCFYPTPETFRIFANQPFLNDKVRDRMHRLSTKPSHCKRRL